MKAKLRELVEEFRAVFAGRSNLADSVIPPIIFLIVNPLLGFDYAVWGSLLISLLVSLFRLSRGQSLKYALGGLGGVILAVLAAKLLNRAVQFFFFQEAQAGALAVVNVIMGWPATVVLLALSYVYGLWRLGHLQGPSVAEFEAGAEPPWTGQRRGF